MGGSVAFDRAAEFYDASRAMPEDAMARTLALLEEHLRGRGLVLEVGVGTGLLALPLHERGIPLVGLDLAAPMLAKLVQKAGGAAPFPLVIGDATGLPMRDDAVDAAYLRWVLHLVRDWRGMLAEIVRVVRPDGVFLANMGDYGGARKEIHQRFGELTGVSVDPVGLGWGRLDELDAAMTDLGATIRELPSLDESFAEPLDDFIRGVEDDRYSWTWPIDAEVRLRAAAEIRPWAEERFGDLSAPRHETLEIVWRAYDLA